MMPRLMLREASGGLITVTQRLSPHNWGAPASGRTAWPATYWIDLPCTLECSDERELAGSMFPQNLARQRQ
jgi:hypothetical protein